MFHSLHTDLDFITICCRSSCFHCFVAFCCIIRVYVCYCVGVTLVLILQRYSEYCGTILTHNDWYNPIYFTHRSTPFLTAVNDFCHIAGKDKCDFKWRVVLMGRGISTKENIPNRKILPKFESGFCNRIPCDDSVKSFQESHAHATWWKSPWCCMKSDNTVVD